MRAQALAVGCFLVVVLGQYIVKPPGAEDSKDERHQMDTPVRVVFPAHPCVLESGKVELVALAPPQGEGPREAPSLRVDGEPHDWQPYEPPVFVARLRLAPGKHTLTVGNVSLGVFIAEAGKSSPEQLPALKDHPGHSGAWKDCSVCHETAVREGLLRIGEWRGHEACFACHDSVEFAVAHSHPEEPLWSCPTCHAVHGSIRPALLTAPAEKLCTECHD